VEVEHEVEVERQVEVVPEDRLKEDGNNQCGAALAIKTHLSTSRYKVGKKYYRQKNLM